MSASELFLDDRSKSLFEGFFPSKRKINQTLAITRLFFDSTKAVSKLCKSSYKNVFDTPKKFVDLSMSVMHLFINDKKKASPNRAKQLKELMKTLCSVACIASTLVAAYSIAKDHALPESMPALPPQAVSTIAMGSGALFKIKNITNIFYSYSCAENAVKRLSNKKSLNKKEAAEAWTLPSRVYQLATMLTLLGVEIFGDELVSPHFLRSMDQGSCIAKLANVPTKLYKIYG